MTVTAGRALARAWLHPDADDVEATTSEGPADPNEAGLWLAEQARPGTAANNLALCLEFDRELDHERLHRAVTAVAARHPALRTSFHAGDDGGVRKRVAPPAEARPDVRFSDLRHITGDVERISRDLLEASWAEPFDLSRPGLLRVHHLHLPGGRDQVLLGAHHLVCDGPSLVTLLEDLGAAHDRPDLPPAATRPARADDPADVAHWAEALDGVGRLDLSADVTATTGGADGPVVTVEARVPGEVRTRVQVLAARLRTTPYTVLLTALAVHLARRGAALEPGADIALGVPFAAGQRRGSVGLHVSALPVRVRFGWDDTFADTVARTGGTLFAGLSHGRVSLGAIIAALRAREARVADELFEVHLVKHERTAPTCRLGGAVGRPFTITRPAMATAVEVHVQDEGDGWSLVVDARATLFTPTTVERLAHGFVHVVDELTARPDVPLSSADLLGAAEHAQLDRWAGEDRAISSGDVLVDPPTSLYDAFSRQARRTPDAVAVVDAGGRDLTYAQLARASGGVARWLAARAAPGSRVAVEMPRDVDLVVALLGVLAAGCAYVPLDPAYPAERTRFIEEDSAVATTVRALPDAADCDRSRPADRAVSPDHPAYVVYTSGSTGVPKGVVMTHGNALHLIAWAHRAYRAEDLAAVVASTSVCFDLSVFEIFAPLTCGGRVVVTRDALAVLDPGPARTATLLNTVPSAAREWVAAGWPTTTVRTVNLAGEALDGALTEALLACPGVEEVVNLYGPSEDTTYSTVHRMSLAEYPTPIGRPLPGERVHVLDGALRRVPVGGVGELHLAGPGVALGYHGQPGLTASRFLPDPWGPPGSRMYRTGDHVRFRADGALLYLGRGDAQVKVRGHRVELGEVQAHVLAHPGVRDAAVALVGDALVAYVEGDLADTDLRASLRSTLPAHAVPSQVVKVASLPRTPNGKLDRARLPAPSSVAPTEPSQAPRTDAERAVAAAWTTVLDRSGFGRDDDFLELGGHSLAMTRVRTALRDATGVQLSVAAMFAATRLRELALLLEGGDDGDAPYAAWAGATRDGSPMPLSSGERRLLFLQELGDGSERAYVSQAALRLHGEIDADVLQRAVDQVVDRHEILRTTYHPSGTGPVRRIADHVDVPVRPVAGPGDTSDRGVDAWAHAQAPTFHLATGPLLDLAIGACGTHSVLLLTVHHIITDGWSFAMLADELGRAVARVVAGDTAAPPAPPQYADYAAWEQQQESQYSDGFWASGWDGLEALDLPATRPDRRSDGCDRTSFTLDPDDTAALTRVGAARGATTSAVCLAVWDLVLARWTGARRFAVATVTAHRDDSAAERTLGFFANTVVHRADLRDPGLSFADLVDRTATDVGSALEHAGTPFDRIVRLARAGGDLPPDVDLYRVSYAFQSMPPAVVTLPGVRVEPVELTPVGAVSELGLSVWPTVGGGLRFHLQAPAGFLDVADLRRVAEAYRQAAAAVRCDPSIDVDVVPLASRAVIVDDTAESSADDTARWTVAEHVAHWASTTPDARAVTWDTSGWTYAQLDRVARTVAADLRTAGVRPDDVVAVDLPRDGRWLGGVLGVWRAGAAFLALDCSLPPGRRDYMLDDAGVSTVLTAEDLDRAVTRSADATTEADTDTDTPRAPHAASHVAYTSGSTGRPKGVVAEHAQLTAFLRWVTAEHLDVGHGAPVPTPLTFDLSFAAVFGPLVRGTVVALLPVEAPPMPHLVDLLTRERGLSFLKLTPGHLSLLSHDLPAAGLDGAVHRLVVAGETLERRHLAIWAQRAPSTPVVNEYGPTETVVGCLRSTFTPDALDEGPIPIGRPAPGTHVRVVDRAGADVVPGGIGELVIGGAQVARGYLGQPGRTAQVFVPDPHVPGGRAYRTGDLVRERADGQVVHLGRRDLQVKVRGYRIELGEIETRLVALPDVHDAVVVVSGEGPAAVLVAFVVVGAAAGRTFGGPADGTLRDALARDLPDYMVPARFRVLESLPLAGTGKVDRAALTRLADEAVPDAPRSPADALDAAVREVWCEVLRVSSVDDDDDFFALGGHSLLATQVVARLEDRGVQGVSLRAVFDHPLLRDLVAALRALGGRSGTTAPLPVAPRVPHGRGSVLAPASRGQERIWSLTRLDAVAQQAHVIQGALLLHGDLDPALLDEALRQVATRNESLRTTLRHVDDRLSQVVAAVPAVRLEVLEELDEAEWADLQTQAADMDLERGPLLRVHLVGDASSDDGARLLVTMHHAVADGWSTAELAAQVTTAYAALSEGRQPTWDAPPAQFADVVQWQLDLASAPGHADDVAAAARDLVGCEPLRLRTDLVPSAAPSFSGGVVRGRVGPETVAAVRGLATSTGSSPFVVVLAAFALLMARHSGQTRFAVGVPVSGRDRPEFESVIGFLVDTVAVPVDVRPDASVAQTLLDVRECLLRALERHHVAVEEVATELAALGHTAPGLQVVVNQLTQPPVQIRLPGVEVARTGLERASSKFDVEVYVSDGEDGSWGLELNYRSDLFEVSTAQFLLDGYRTVLTQLAEPATARPVREVSVVPTDDAHDAAADESLEAESRPDTGDTVVAQFLRRAAQDPGHVAVTAGDAVLTRAQLLTRARAVSTQVQMVCDPEDRVAILGTHDDHAIVAVLGCSLAGTTYVALDRDAPVARQQEVLRRSGARALVVAPALRTTAEEILDCHDGGRLPLIDTTTSVDTVSPDQVADAAGAAYVLFTSGSTGRPKGLVQTHANLAAHVANYRDGVGVRSDDRCTLLSTITFDASVLDIWTALSQGATLCVIDLRGDGPAAARDALARQRVTVLHATPSAFRLLGAHRGEDLPDSVTTVVFGGESVADTDLASLAGPPHRRVVNLYGASECSVITLADLPVADAPGHGSPTVGRPVPGVQVRLVDRSGHDTEIIGEVVCTTALLARPLDTTPEPPTDEYALGDVAWRLPDGRYTLAGRTDGQLKLRGHRVNTAEVEGAVRHIEDVDDVAVVARTDDHEQPQLVAFFTGDAEADDVSSRLRASLPHHLVPAVVAHVEDLPHTRTGKLDRASLPEPEWTTPTDDPPCAGLETTCALVIGEVLGVDDVGRDTDLFRLGGQSLHVYQVASRLSEQLGVDVAPRLVFEKPTVKALAEHLERRPEDGAVTSSRPLRPSARRRQPQQEEAS